MPGCDALLTMMGKGKKLLPSPGFAHSEWASPHEGFSKLCQLRTALKWSSEVHNSCQVHGRVP